MQKLPENLQETSPKPTKNPYVRARARAGIIRAHAREKSVLSEPLRRSPPRPGSRFFRTGGMPLVEHLFRTNETLHAAEIRHDILHSAAVPVCLLS